METQGRDMEMAGIPRTEIKTLQTYLQETKINDRLVIAQKLATDPDSIPPLTGFSWNFQVPIQKTISPDVDAKLRQIIEDRYGV